MESSMRRRIMRTLALLGVALVAPAIGAGNAAAQSFKVFRPAATGPVPAVIFVSGCSGFVAAGDVNSYEERAQELQKAGYLVAFADWLRQSGQKDCTTTTHAKAAETIAEVATWLRAQPDVDQRRISAIGWSFGGGVLLAMMANKTPAPFQKAVLFYPDCRTAKPIQSGTPTLVLFAGQDDVTPPSSCGALTGSRGVQAVTYPAARHGFDMRGLPESQRYAFGTLGFHSTAAAQAWGAVTHFLR